MVRTTTRDRPARWPGVGGCLRTVIVAAAFFGVLPCHPKDAVAGDVPEVPSPTCVDVPGNPCSGGGSAPSSSSSYSHSGYSSGGYSSSYQTKMMIMRSLQQSIDKMTTPNPAVLQRIHQTQVQDAAARQQEVMSEQKTEEQRQQQAEREAEAARSKQLKDLANSLQGMPNDSGSQVELRPGAGTPFFGEGGSGGAVPADSSLEKMRAAASDGFDTSGHLLGQMPKAPPPASPPRHYILKLKPIPPDKLTPKVKDLLKQREELDQRQRQLEDELNKLEAKSNLTPDETVTMVNLKQDLSVTDNKENYITFSINDTLP